MNATLDGSVFDKIWMSNDLAGTEFMKSYMNFVDRYYRRTLTPPDFAAWYEDRLQAVLVDVKARSPFYRERFADIEPAEIGLDRLATLPFTSKLDLRDAMLDIMSGSVNEGTFFYETTGTTGPATPCPRGPAEVVASNVHVTESWSAIISDQFGERRPVIGLMGPTEIHSFGDTLGDVSRNVGACNAKIWPYSPLVGFQRALELMRDLKIGVICCTPGVALNLYKAALSYGFDIERDFAVELLFVTGEMCTPALAHNLGNLWDARVVNILYGSQEAFVIGVACEAGRMHLSQPNYIVEVLDPSTANSLGAFGQGELCVTTVVPGVKPLIRYRTGDMVSIAENSCDCSLPGPNLQVLGRVRDRIELGANSVLASEIESATLSELSHCTGYQIVIERDLDGCDVVEVRVELDGRNEGAVESVRSAIIDRYEQAFGVRATVEVIDDLDQIVSTGAFVSWKAARIVDRRVAPGVEEAAAAALATRRGYAGASATQSGGTR